MAKESKVKFSKRLELWQRRLAESNSKISSEIQQMDERERLYNGDKTLRPLVQADLKQDGVKKTSHVRNIIFENIESQISSEIPQPKVTARRKEDEKLAAIIENFLRNELDCLPFETINDIAERTVPIQGGAYFLIEWDNEKRTHSTIGETTVTFIHPKQIAPQPGIYTSVGDMDWIIIKMPTTKETIRRKYDINIYAESDSEPDVRTTDGTGTSEAELTQYIGFERNKKGGINRYSWVNSIELEDIKNYQARRQPTCAACNHVRPLNGQKIVTERGEEEYNGGSCPWCGGDKFVGSEQEHDYNGIPYYKPDAYPLILQRSVSVYGQLLGNSDVDQIRDQQNTTNRLEQKIIDRLVKAGTRITLPDRPDLRTDPIDGERWFLNGPQEKAMIDVYEFTGNLEYELRYLANVYDEARQILGITDSFQGRRDTTATSGKAKEFAAAQSAGRLESKRVMKEAAYAEMFELMFKFWLAYSDEPRMVVYKNFKGENEYQEFNRYDFLVEDESGIPYWNDQFLFSCDRTESLASNREAMWQETRMNLQTGAFGDPASTETLILFWGKMEELHYPGAGSTKSFLEEKMRREQMQQQQMAQQQAMPPQGASDMGEIPPEILQAIEEQARADAMQAAGGQI